jgi:hypothetical protein
MAFGHRCRFYSAPRAVVLLVILLSHLALMASPLHVVAAHLDDAAPARAEVDWHGEIGDTLWPSAATDQHVGDCAPELVSPAGLALRFPADSALSGNVGLLRGDPMTADIVARTLGPPESADTQALLQVFRL